MTINRTVRALLACTSLVACAGVAHAQDDVTARLNAMEATLRAQQAQIAQQQQTIDQQAAAIRDLRRQTTVPAQLAGNPTSANAILSAPAPAGGTVVAATQDGTSSTTQTATSSAAGQAAQQNQAAATALADSTPPSSTGTDTLGIGVRRALDATRALAAADLERPKVSMVSGRPTIASADGRYSLSLRGIAQADAGFYFQDAQGPNATDFRRGSVGAGSRENNAAQDLSNGVNFRRARFGAEGVIDQNFSYRLIFEFGGSGTEGPARINDAWIAYTGFAPFTIQAGAFSPPANLEDSTSPEDQLFLERASGSELSRTIAGADGRVGLGVRATGHRNFFAATLTSATVNDAESFDEQLAAVGRVATLIASDQDGAGTYNILIGANGSYVFNPPDSGLLNTAGTTNTPRYAYRFRDRPELRLDSTRLIDTGAIDSQHVDTEGVEFGANYKNILVQAEGYRYGIDRYNSTLANPEFWAGYVEASWVLTGESRRYNTNTASWQNPRPLRSFSPATGGWGAFELAARYSYTNLNYHSGQAGTAAQPGQIRGGKQQIETIGLNWYLNTNFKLLFDFQHVQVDRLNPAGPGNLTPFGAGALTPPIGAQIGQTYNAFAVRSQFAF